MSKKESLIKTAATSYFEDLRKHKESLTNDEMMKLRKGGVFGSVRIWKTKVSDGSPVYVIHTHKKLKMAKSLEGIIYQYHKHFKK